MSDGSEESIPFFYVTLKCLTNCVVVYHRPIETYKYIILILSFTNILCWSFI